MARVWQSTTLSVSIQRQPKRVYDFVSNPPNLPRWATTFCRSVRRLRGQWIIQTPQGPVNIRLARKNAVGVLDHEVRPAAGSTVFVPMRVVPNNRGSEVLLTLFRQTGMSATRYVQDIDLVKQDLKTLKSVMEAGTSRGRRR